MDLDQLKALADKLNLTYSNNIGVVKLKENLEAHCINLGTTFDKEYTKYLEELKRSLEASQELKNDISEKDNTSVKNNTGVSVQQLKNLTFAKVEKKVKQLKTDERLKEAMRLIRCQITCNNKNKVSYSGEIFSVRNAVLPEVKKFIPFNTPTHIPQILLNMIKEKKYQMFKKEKINGNVVTKSYLIDEYNIQILPPLTPNEIEAIKQKQLAEGFNGE